MGRLLTPEETRQQLRCSLPKVYQLSSSGMLPKYKIGNRLFFKEQDVSAYIESCRIEARVPVEL